MKTIDEILLELIKRKDEKGNAHTFFKYYVYAEFSREEEVIVLRSSWIPNALTDLLLDNGFKIDLIKSDKEHADTRAEVTFKRPYQAKEVPA